MSFPAIFALIVGFGMIAQWFMSYLSHGIPELETEPIRIWFHISGEIITALLLITSGIGLLAGWALACYLFLLAAGMLLYTVIVSPGYFAQKGEWAWVGFFSVVLVLTILASSQIVARIL